MKLKILMTPEERLKHINTILEIDGLAPEIIDDPSVGYGIIALSGLGNDLSPANENIKACLQNRQDILHAAMKKANIELYDPATAPYSLDANPSAQPDEIFAVDSLRIAMARYITFIDVIATTGSGIELEKARGMGKFIVIFHDPNIRTSRMQPNRTIHLSADNFEALEETLTELFKFLNEFEPAIGVEIEDDHTEMPVAIGRNIKTGKFVNLEKEITQRWPELTHQYDGSINVLEMSCQNTDIFFENNKDNNN